MILMCLWSCTDSHYLDTSNSLSLKASSKFSPAILTMCVLFQQSDTKRKHKKTLNQTSFFFFFFSYFEIWWSSILLVCVSVFQTVSALLVWILSDSFCSLYCRWRPSSWMTIDHLHESSNIIIKNGDSFRNKASDWLHPILYISVGEKRNVKRVLCPNSRYL